MANPDRAFLFAGGLAGALGVALSALAAHSGGGNVATAASFFLVHAPAFLVLSLLAASRMARIGGAVLVVGLMLFSGDLLCRQFLGTRLFLYAAPGGGLLLIGGWLSLAVSAVFQSSRKTS